MARGKTKEENPSIDHAPLKKHLLSWVKYWEDNREIITDYSELSINVQLGQLKEAIKNLEEKEEREKEERERKESNG